MQACRNRSHWRRVHANRPLGCTLAFRFQYCLRHFLYEQRDAVGALDDVLPNTCKKELVADDAVDHGADVALCQPIESEGSDVLPSDPRRRELRAEYDDQQYAEARDPIHCTIK